MYTWNTVGVHASVAQSDQLSVTTKMLKKILFVLTWTVTSMMAYAAEPVSAKVFLSNVLWDVNGRQFSLENLKGKPVLINFWASWCGGCKAEIEDLNALRKEVKGEFDVVGVSIDDDTKVVRDFSRATNMSYLSLVSGGLGPPLMRSMGNQKNGVPFTVFIDKNGLVTYSKLGVLQKKDFDLLRSKATL